jgi:hypothetical protein
MSQKALSFNFMLVEQINLRAGFDMDVRRIE